MRQPYDLMPVGKLSSKFLSHQPVGAHNQNLHITSATPRAQKMPAAPLTSDLLRWKRPDCSLEFIKREVYSFGRQPQGILTQVATLIQNCQQHQTGTQLNI